MRPCCLASLQTWSIIALYEWRLLSYAGALGVGWSIMWYFLCYKSPADHPRISAIEREYIEKALDTAPRKVRIRLWAPLHSWCFSERVQTVINLIVSIWLRCGAHVSFTVCSKKSYARIEITITATNLTRIKYPFSILNYDLSGANVANFNKIHCTVFDQQLFKKWN